MKIEWKLNDNWNKRRNKPVHLRWDRHVTETQLKRKYY